MISYTTGSDTDVILCSWSTIISYKTGSATAADSYREAVPEAADGYPGAGSAGPLPRYAGQDNHILGSIG